MTRLLTVLAALWMGVTATVASAQQLSLGEVSNYLNRLQTLTGEFTQINSDGTISTGTIYLKRPGRVRFEYNPPERQLVLATGGAVALFDARSNTGPEQYPLNQTPLSIILAPNVNLGQANMVTGHTSDGTTTTITAQDPRNPEYGNIQMVYTGNPVQLRQWIVTDDTGAQTTVILGDTTEGASIPNRLFNLQAELRDWNG